MVRFKVQKAKRAGRKFVDPLVAITGVFLATLPFVFSTAGLDKFRLPKDVATVLFTFLLAVLFLAFRGPRFQVSLGVWEKVALGFLAFSGLHTLVSRRPDLGLDSWFYLLSFGLLFFLLREIAGTKQQIRLWYAAAAGLAANAILTILQYYGLVSAFQTLSGETISGRLNPAGLIGEVNSGGFLFGLVSLILLYGVVAEKSRARRRLALVLLAANLAGLLFTRTITSLVAWLACLPLWVAFYLWWLRKASARSPMKPAVLGLAVVILLGGGLLAASRSGMVERLEATWRQIEQGDWTVATAGRFPVYQLTWRMIQEQPWRGRGLGTFARDFYRARSDSEYGRQLQFIDQPGAFQQAHNEYLQVWLELGAIGLLFSLFLLLAPALAALAANRARIEQDEPDLTCWRATLAVAVFYVALSCLTFFPFHLSVTAAFVTLLLAGLRRAQYESKASGQAQTRSGSMEVKLWQRFRLAGLFLVVAAALILAFPQIQRWRANQNAGIAAFLLERAAWPQTNLRQRRLFADEALDHLREAGKQSPGFDEIYNLMGTAFLFLGQFEQASEVYRKAAAELPSPEVYTNLAAALIEQNRLEEARQSLQMALYYNPQYQRALKARAYLDGQSSP